LEGGNLHRRKGRRRGIYRGGKEENSGKCNLLGGTLAVCFFIVAPCCAWRVCGKKDQGLGNLYRAGGGKKKGFWGGKRSSKEKENYLRKMSVCHYNLHSTKKELVSNKAD